jgi:hypothetical protein
VLFRCEIVLVRCPRSFSIPGASTEIAAENGFSRDLALPCGRFGGWKIREGDW